MTMDSQDRWDDRHKVPIRVDRSIAAFVDNVKETARHRVAWTGGRLDVLVRPCPSDVLIVAFHGALDRSKYELPRFERLATLTRRDESLLFLADPLLLAAPDLTLGWYIGTESDPLRSALAELSRGVAAAVGAQHILLVGSSGGGFAALQTSARLPGSLALAFSPQSRVARYYKRPVDRFVRACFAGAAPLDWEERLGDRCSLLPVYRRGTDNIAVYVQNVHDPFHLEEHCRPFAASLGLEPGEQTADGRVEIRLIESRDGHHPPTDDEFVDELDRAIDALRSSRFRPTATGD